MSNTGAFAAAGTCFASSFLLSWVSSDLEEKFPERFAELASAEHGHEVAYDPTEVFFEARELAGRVKWLMFSMGVIFMVRGALSS
jgi:hypothetical protein